MISETLRDQVGVITGASSGIGAGVAEELSACGMKLVLNGRREGRLRELSDRLGDNLFVVGDLTDPDLPDRLIATALDHYGRCDVVFNNAGVMHSSCYKEANVDLLCSMVRVNVEAATRMAYTAMAHFQKAGRGHLVNVSSILGTKVRPSTGVYAATKYAIEALSEALRMETAKSNIKVSVIEPGVVDTELQNHFSVHPRDALGITQPLSPSDIARCVRFILEQPPHVRIPVMMVMPGEQEM